MTWQKGEVPIPVSARYLEEVYCCVQKLPRTSALGGTRHVRMEEPAVDLKVGLGWKVCVLTGTPISFSPEIPL